jgi:hypothetical protein
MMKSADIRPGLRVGFLTAVAKTTKTLTSGRRMPAWSLRCDCGRIVVAMTVNLVKGKHQSCGCKRGELTAAHYTGDTKRPEYRIYRQMLDRCYLETAQNYQWYGGKGVTVCECWRRGTNEKTGFQCFFEDMGERPEGLTLDREDPFKPYEPGNCRWATWETQHANKREHHMSPYERAALRKQRSEARRGEKSPVAKLTDRQVAVIKRRIAEGARTSDLARQFNVAPQTICGIKRGDKYKHVMVEAA